MYNQPTVKSITTSTITEDNTMNLHTMMSRASELVCLIESCELMGFGEDTVNMYEDLKHLETSIEIAIANELDDEAAAEEAKMARDVQEYADSLPNMPF